MDQIEVKDLTKDMIDECVDLYMDVFSREPWNDVFESREQVIPYFTNSLANNYYLGYVAMKDGKIIGLCVGMKKPWLAGLEYYIDEFCVHMDLQGQGIGSYFLKEVETRAKEEGVNGFLLNTSKNYDAFQFYEKNGYSPIGDLVVLGK
jgi:GNAT superfamily N-acetyltransferase